MYVRTYSVMQSDGNSFCGDVVLDSFNKASRDENNILDQMYKSKKCSDYFYDDFNSLSHYTKMLTYRTVALKPNFMSSLLCKASVIWMGHQLSQLFETFVFIRLGIDLADLREHPLRGGHLSSRNVASFEFKRFF